MGPFHRSADRTRDRDGAARRCGDPGSGRRIAQTWCANCHRVGPSGPGATTDVAPAFAVIASMPSTTALSLRVFLQTPHANMPDYRLSRDQLDDVIAYILSLQRR